MKGRQMDMINNIVKDSIKVEKKELEPCLQQIDFTIPSDKVELGYNTLAKSFAKEANLQGFRPGKAPVSMVKKLYKKNIEEEMVKELCSAAFQPVSEDIDMLSYNFTDNKQPEIKLGEDFSFSLKVNVAPEITLPEYKGIKIELEKNELKESDLEDRIKYFREIYGKFENVVGGAGEGDMVKVSYTSDVELPEDAKGHVKNLISSEVNYIWLNNNDEMIPGINEALKGKEAGATVKHAAKFANSFEEEVLARKTVNYEIKIDEVQRKVPIESDEELCSKLMVKDIDELKDRVRKMAEQEVESANNTLKKNKVVDILTKDLDFPVPPDVLKEATSNEFSAMISEKMKDKDADKEKLQKEIKDNRDKFMKEAEEKALVRVKNFLLLRKIGKVEKLQVEEQELDRHIQQISQHYGQKPEDVKQKLMDSGNISQVVDEVLINKVTDLIANEAEVTYVESKKSDQ
jgi:trigger factor